MNDSVEDGVGEQKAAAARDQALKDLVAQSDLTDIRVTKWHAELLSDGPEEVGELDLKLSSAFRYRNGGFDIRFSVDAPLVSPGGEEKVASIQVAVVASFSLDAGERPPRDLMKSFMDQVAFFVAMPFIREGLHSLSMRIGLEPITIGLLHKGKVAPQTAWTSRRQFNGISTDQESLGPGGR
ncbi:hypothetical protein [Micromonospora yangpuensis]|uniref:hypothetical protein n=1 Tax=Micromonospora yangpuensis TaxID=683228 RepID=UPI001112F4AE|nr:hypothetical protein [Micromonospora yangpuensis]GGM20772.1 hypothetical protein GCM10012279_43990 [Micromonospora yangpuensis]